MTMTTTTYYYLCAVPRPEWEQSAVPRNSGARIADFVADALGCERRISKGVNLAAEYGRYSVCCQRLEQVALACGCIKVVESGEDLTPILREGLFPAIRLDASYLALLAAVGDHPPARFGASFFPPDQVLDHTDAFERWAVGQGETKGELARQRVAFFRAAAQHGCGIVELQSGFHRAQVDRPLVLDLGAKATRDDSVSLVTIPALESIRPSDQRSDDSRQRKAERLRSQIRAALRRNEPVSFGNKGFHDVIPEVLNEFVFVPPGATVPRSSLRVVYTDGSEAKPIPIFCLMRLPYPVSAGGEGGSPPLRAALMSMRHHELDSQIDYYWFRNREVSRPRTMAEDDQFCLDATIEQLRESLEVGDLAIHLYITGFEPAVIGFYRGLVQTLLELGDKRMAEPLRVVPYYYTQGDTLYQPGTPWQ